MVGRRTGEEVVGGKTTQGRQNKVLGRGGEGTGGVKGQVTSSGGRWRRRGGDGRVRGQGRGGGAGDLNLWLPIVSLHKDLSRSNYLYI